MTARSCFVWAGKVDALTSSEISLIMKAPYVRRLV
jgi:hypothetical protein